jgi:hypothetical protein
MTPAHATPFVIPMEFLLRTVVTTEVATNIRVEITAVA